MLEEKWLEDFRHAADSLHDIGMLMMVVLKEQTIHHDISRYTNQT
jgi:hypothetical protein